MGVCCMPASRRYASTYRDDGQSDGSVKAGGQTYSAEDELEADMRDGGRARGGKNEETIDGGKQSTRTQHPGRQTLNPKPETLIG